MHIKYAKALKKIESFEPVRLSFFRFIYSRAFFKHEILSIKSVLDRFMRLEKSRRDAARKAERQSGYLKVESDLDLL